MNGLAAAGLTAALSVAVAADGLGAALWPGFVALFLLALTMLIATGAGRRAIAGMDFDITDDESNVAAATTK